MRRLRRTRTARNATEAQPMLLKTARKMVIAVIGSTVILIGLIGLVLPVLPGFIFIPIGLTILATEFIWARRLLRKVKRTTADMVGKLRGTSSHAGPHQDTPMPRQVTADGKHT